MQVEVACKNGIIDAGVNTHLVRVTVWTNAIN